MVGAIVFFLPVPVLVCSPWFDWIVVLALRVLSIALDLEFAPRLDSLIGKLLVATFDVTASFTVMRDCTLKPSCKG